MHPINIPPRPGTSAIKLVDVANDTAFPSAPCGSVLLSSVSLGWRGIVVESHHLEPQELPEHYVIGHGLAISTCKAPLPFGWKDGDRRRDGVLNPGEFHLLTHGELNAPRWLQPFDEISIVLDRQFVADTVCEGLSADAVELTTRRSASDATILAYAQAFHAELESNSANGLLYADTLTTGYALHLLTHYAIAKPRIPRLRGKLNAAQLRAVLDFIQAHLNEDLSLGVLAERANVSPFHFARQFRATVGATPHQFVLRQRIQRSVGLVKAGQLSLARIAVESGFHDQAHFTRAFRAALGTTPAIYSGSA